MEIAFETKELRTICEIEAHAQDRLGDETAGAPKRRLADIRSAETISDLIAGRPRELDNGTGQMVIDLYSNYRLVFCANHPSNTVADIGNLDWSRVSRVKILSIEVYLE